MTSASPRTGRHLGLLLLGWVGVAVAVIVLAPFRFGPPDMTRVGLLSPGGGWPADLLLNVVLFLPVGFLIHRLGAGQVSVVMVAGWCLALSLGIEFSQIFLPGRWPTGSDVVGNGVGALLGALASRGLRATLGEGSRLLGRTLLDLPLTGLAYLMVPWIWLIGVGSTTAPVRVWALLPLGVAGGIALAGAARSSATQDGRMDRYLTRITFGWTIVVTAPAVGYGLTVVATTLGATMVAAWLADLVWRGERLMDRRIEPRVLRIVAPLVIVALLGMPYEAGTLSLESGTDPRFEMVRWLERIAGYGVLGYVIAEWRGRLEVPILRGLLAPMLGALLIVGGELALGSASPLMGVMLTAAIPAGAGAALYHLSRLHVRYLRGPAALGASQ